MDFVKREDHSVIDEESYKAYMENLQKSHHIEQMEYQHTPISMEQLHQVMQTSLNASNLVHNFSLPISPRQMSTLMLKTNHVTRSFAEIPAHLSRNLDIELGHSLAAELPQNLCHDDLLSQNLNRNIDASLVRSLNGDIDLQSLPHALVHNLSEDLHLNHEMDLSHHLNREPEILHEERRTPMVVQCVPDANVDQMRLEQNIPQRLDPNIPERLEQNIAQRLDQNIAERLEQNIMQRLDQSIMQRLDQSIIQRLDQSFVQRLDENLQRLEQNGQRLDQDIAQRLHQTVVQRLDQIGQRLDQNLVQSLDQVGQRLDQRLVNGNERQMEQNGHVMPMQFHIKSEQEDDSYFYENINNIPNAEVNGHIQTDTQSNQPAVQSDAQIYPMYTLHTNIPALNPIDLYSRTQNYPQNYARDNPQNLVVHKQYNSPYPEEKKPNQDDEVKLKTEQPKENLKPTDQNKIYNEFPNSKDESKLSEELSMNIKGEYVCYKCNEIFPSKRGLKQHAKGCIENDDSEKIGKFGCTQCAYRCQSPAILKIHERTHSGEKPFSCNLCDYKSGQKNNVAKHILVHMKEKPFRCQYCDYRCAQKNNLVVHERTHTGYKPFACPYCSYRTVQKPNLVKHMYLHTDQKPFSCDLCSYRCVQKTNLTKHKQRHLSDKDLKMPVKEQRPYKPRQKSVKCMHCAYRCVQKLSMEKHMELKHPGLEFSVEAFESVSDNTVENVNDVQNLTVKKDVYTEMEESVVS